MENYSYHKKLKSLWEKAVSLYENGQRGADSFFDENEISFLASIGMSAQEMYDYAEDYINDGDPDYTNMVLVQDIRRSYFLNELEGKSTGKVVMNDELPPKDEAVRDIVWLPRVLRKAKVKLMGEMNPDLMYGCGGDRKFFKEHDIHPAEFLAYVRDHMDDDQAVISWVQKRSAAAK